MNNPQKNQSNSHLTKPESLSLSNKLHPKLNKFNSWKTTFVTWPNKRKIPHLDKTVVQWNKTVDRLQWSLGKKDKLTKSTEIWGPPSSQSINSKSKLKGWETTSKKTRNWFKWYLTCKNTVGNKIKFLSIASIKWEPKSFKNNSNTLKPSLEIPSEKSAWTSDPYF